MSILVTGATGFVGINLLEQLLAEGREVVAFADRPLPPAAARVLGELPGDLTVILADVREKSALLDAMRAHNVDHVIHGAVITSGVARERQQAEIITGVNLAGTAAAAQAAAEHGVARFLLVGSIAVFSDMPRRITAELREDMPHDPVSLYSIGKSAGERIVRRIASLHGMDFRIGRLGTVFGPWEHDTGRRDTLSAVHQSVAAARAGRAVTLPRPALKNWHYARDAARCLITLLDAPAPHHEVYHLGPPQAWTLQAWCERLAQRYLQFSFTLGEGPGEPIELYGREDTAFLSSERFGSEFGPTSTLDLEAIFEDYLGWVEAMDGWGLQAQPAAALA